MSTDQNRSSLMRRSHNERTTRTNQDSVFVSKRYGTHDGHEIELEFDQKLLALNRARLAVDGELVDTTMMIYGPRELTSTLQDSTSVVVKIDSGMFGELVRAPLRGADGSWVDLVKERVMA